MLCGPSHNDGADDVVVNIDELVVARMLMIMKAMWMIMRLFAMSPTAISS